MVFLAVYTALDIKENCVSCFLMSEFATLCSIPQTFFGEIRAAPHFYSWFWLKQLISKIGSSCIFLLKSGAWWIRSRFTVEAASDRQMLTKPNTLPTPQAVRHSWPQASLLPLRPVHYKRSAAPSSIIRTALCSPFFSPYWMNRPVNEGPLCPPCLSCVPWCSGAQLDKSQTASALFAHYSHYPASNQCRTGCWDLSTTHKVLGSLVLLPVRDPATKSVCRGRGRQISAARQNSVGCLIWIWLFWHTEATSTQTRHGSAKVFMPRAGMRRYSRTQM